MIQLRHKKTDQIISCDYQNGWIEKIVNKGIAHEFEILKYPDIVQLMFVQPLGDTVTDKILDRTEAIKIKNKYPQNYFLTEINIKNQILDDIGKSNIIGMKINRQTIRIISRRILYFLTFAFILPIFSKRARIKAKTFIDHNNASIQITMSLLMIIFTLYMIYLMR